tara:strand:+ start:2109 stop:3230 length:1122 start_codon:yes stop_codon:yes gene_type:complete
MKIFYLVNAKIDSKAAHAVNMASTCNAMSELGHDVSLITRNILDIDFNLNNYYKNYSIKFPFKVVKIPFLNFNFLRNLSFSFNAIRYVIKENPDIIYIRYSLDFIILFFINKKIIIERHSPLSSNLFIKFFQSFTYGFNNVAKIIIITDSLKKIILSQKLKLKKKLYVHCDGANIVSLKNDNNIKLQGSFENNIGYFGHLYEGRGIDLIINIAIQNSNLGFHLIGGLDKDVKRWIEKSKALENIFFYGYLPHNKLVSYAMLMDILLAPYQNNVKVPGGPNTVKWMSPLKIFEYMSFKKPIICSNIEVLHEVLENNVNSLLVNSKNVDAWTFAIKSLLNDNQFAELLVNNAYSDLTNKYSWRKRVQAILDFSNE